MYSGNKNRQFSIVMALKTGEKAPDFKLPGTQGDFELSKDAAQRPLILYFYPKDFTRVCTKEACSFRDEFSVFQGLNIPVVGISRDSVATHKRFAAQHQLPFPLLADESGKVAKAYKALIPVLRLPKRITYLLDKNHRIAAVYEDMFGAESHIRQMLKELEEK